MPVYLGSLRLVRPKTPLNCELLIMKNRIVIFQNLFSEGFKLIESNSIANMCRVVVWAFRVKCRRELNLEVKDHALEMELASTAKSDCAS